MVGLTARTWPGFTPASRPGLFASAQAWGWLRCGVFLACATVWGISGARAQEPKASKLQVAVWASSCMACHGPDGKAEGTGLALHGRSAEDLSGKLLAYKSGKLKATMMHQHTKGYSDDELRQIAQYFAALK